MQSRADATRDQLGVRDAVFAALPAGGPEYTIDAVTVCDGTDPHADALLLWARHPRLDQTGGSSVPSAVGAPDELGLRTLRIGSDGLPQIDGVESWPFRLQLPPRRVRRARPRAAVLQYGHGFLGEGSQADGQWLREAANRLGFAILACDMQGMNSDILEVWLAVVGGAPGRFPALQDLPMQGVVNQLVQQRLVKTSLADDPDPRWRRGDGALAWDPDVVWYTGNSQGGSVGTVVMGTSLDVQRGVLGVPGSGYPLLLHRSTVFEPFTFLLTVTNDAPDAIPVFLALLGTGWDAFDPLTYAPHLSGDPLPGTPDHEVLFHVAKEDQQVVNETSFISARAAGASLLVPAVRPVPGLPEVPYPAREGAVLVEVDFGIPDDPTPLDPADGDPSRDDGDDPHGWLRRWQPAQDQMVHFLRTGEVINVCGGEACYAPDIF